jgi:hypothetical protein
VRRGIGDVLMWAGAAVGAFGALLLGLGAWMNLPPALVIAIAKALPFVVAAALLTLGAILRRHARRTAELRALAASNQALLDGVHAGSEAVPPRPTMHERARS